MAAKANMCDGYTYCEVSATMTTEPERPCLQRVSYSVVVAVVANVTVVAYIPVAAGDGIVTLLVC
jgi:hypothetical protein